MAKKRKKSFRKDRYHLVDVKESTVPETTYTDKEGRERTRAAHTRSSHERNVLNKEVGRSGEAFDDLADKVADSYEGKKVPKGRRKEVLSETGRPLGRRFERDEAEAIGKRTAGKQFWKRYGKKKGSEILKKER